MKYTKNIRIHLIKVINLKVKKINKGIIYILYLYFFMEKFQNNVKNTSKYINPIDLVGIKRYNS